MAAAPTPLDIAGTVARNIVPLGGILLLGWSASTVLVLYFADTIFALGVMFAGLARHFAPPPSDDGWAARVNGEVGAVGAAAFLAAVVAVPLGVPLVFMLLGSDTTLDSLWSDPSFRTGLLMQAIAAFWSCAGLYRALRTRSPEELGLKKRFSLVFLRWVAVMFVLYSGLAYLFGRFAPILFVAAYAGASIFIDIAPDKFLSLVPEGAADAKTPAPKHRSKHPR